MTDLIWVFVAGYLSVFTLGFQSRVVNHGNYGWAAVMSLLVGVSQASVWTQITKPDAGLIHWLTYGLSGSCAITSAMYIHEKFIVKRKENNSRRHSTGQST